VKAAEGYEVGPEEDRYGTLEDGPSCGVEPPERAMKKTGAKKRVRYTEGMWFAVPLAEGGFGAGVVARTKRGHGVILVYLFGPRRERLPELAELTFLSPTSAIKVVRIGDLHIIDGSWPLLGTTPGWDRRRWPMPLFLRRDPLTGRERIIGYLDDDPIQEVSVEQKVSSGVVLERDGLWGTGAVESVMSELLGR
jgi:hypothetical protein